MTALRLIGLLISLLLVTPFAAAQNRGSWGVNAQDTSDPIATNVNAACTYRIEVNAGGGKVRVNVKNANGNVVKESSGEVEPGDSRDFDLSQGWSIEVVYVAPDSSTGTYERL